MYERQLLFRNYTEKRLAFASETGSPGFDWLMDRFFHQPRKISASMH